MKKYLLPGLLTCFFFSSFVHVEASPTTPKPTSGDSPYSVNTRTTSTRATSGYNPWFVPFDILITRPLGLATTIAGTALFVAFSPFTALSSIAPPHDAFERTADVFIVVPATYTFLRPVGKFLCPGDCRPADIK